MTRETKSRLNIRKKFQILSAYFQGKMQPLRGVRSLSLGVFKLQVNGSIRDSIL